MRDITRSEYSQDEQRKWAWLRAELQAGMNASEAEFIPLDVEKIIKEARARRDERSRQIISSPANPPPSEIAAGRAPRCGHHA